jgi:mxaD protein
LQEVQAATCHQSAPRFANVNSGREISVTCASSKLIINVSAGAVWQVLSDFGAACQYLGMVIDCTVEGQGIGAQRTLTYADSSRIVERLETLDDASQRLSYALLSDTPFRDCLTTVTVYELSPGQCEVAWTASFQPDGLPANEAQEMLEGAFELNGRELQHFLAAQDVVAD